MLITINQQPSNFEEQNLKRFSQEPPYTSGFWFSSNLPIAFSLNFQSRMLKCFLVQKGMFDNFVTFRVLFLHWKNRKNAITTPGSCISTSRDKCTIHRVLLFSCCASVSVTFSLAMGRTVGCFWPKTMQFMCLLQSLLICPVHKQPKHMNLSLLESLSFAYVVFFSSRGHFSIP